MDSSPLGRLPPELRNRIAEYVFDEEGPFQIERKLIRKVSRYSTQPRSSKATKATALLQTCRQLHGELSQLFYSTNTFEFTIPEAETSGWFTTTIKDWVRMIGTSNARSLRPLVLDIGSHTARPDYDSQPSIWGALIVGICTDEIFGVNVCGMICFRIEYEIVSYPSPTGLSQFSQGTVQARIETADPSAGLKRLIKDMRALPIVHHPFGGACAGDVNAVVAAASEAREKVRTQHDWSSINHGGGKGSLVCLET